jgi:hypothetical protein
MRFFEKISHDYGKNTTKFFKDICKHNKKLAQLYNKKIFLLKCKTKSLTPTWLKLSKSKFKHLENNKIFKNTLHKFYKTIINIEIKNTYKEISQLNKNIFYNYTQLKTFVPKNIIDDFKNFQNYNYEKLFQKIKTTQQNKLTKLINNNSTSFKINEHWIKNYSDINIPNDITHLLSLGPKFSLPDNKNNIKTDIINTISNFEYTIENKLATEQTEIRKILNEHLQSTKKYTPLTKLSSIQKQLSDTDKQTKQFLHTHKNNIIVTNADKGSITVILNKTEYDYKADIHLSDTNTYTKIKKDLTNITEKKTNDIIKIWYTKKFINEVTYKKLITKHSQAPKIYFKPKIHKENRPLRPIVSSVNSPTYNLSKYLSNILNKIIGQTQYHIINSKNFKYYIKSKTLLENHILISLDVVSLFTNIPTELALKTIELKWKDIALHTNIHMKTFLDAIDLCINNTYFQYNDTFYKQTSGCAMGNPLSSTIANLVMEQLETDCLKNLPIKPTFYYRYVDDIFTTYHINHTEQLLNTFNNFHPKLQFTIEKENIHKQLPFLDILVIRNTDNTLNTSWFQKPTHSWRYINYYSNTPKSQKYNVLNSIIDKALNLSDPQYRKQNLQKVKLAFKNNNFPTYIINKAIKERTHLLYNNTKKSHDQQTRNTPYVTIPYINDHSKHLKHLITKYNLNITYTKNNNTNDKHFSKLKSKTQYLKHTNVIYNIPCNNCTLTYVGTTNQPLKNRLTQHKSDIKCKPNSTALAQHTKNDKHTFNFDKTKILHYETNLKKRLITEMIYIKTDKHSCNRKNDTILLSQLYNTTLENLNN